MVTRFISTRRFAVVLGAIAPMASWCMVASADVAISAVVDQVTVFRERANVTRRGVVHLNAGEQWLTVTGLPASIKPDTVHVAFESPEAELGAVEFDKVNAKEFASEAENTLRTRITAIEDRRTALQDEVASAQTELKLLDSLAAAPTGGGQRPAVDGASLGGVLTTVNSAGLNARRRMRDAEIRLRKVEAELAAANADLKKVSTSRKETFAVRLAVRASQTLDTQITLQYIIDDAGWEWIYQARLDSEGRTVRLQRQASVEQGTGEDWTDVRLTLTTATPSEDAAPVDLGSMLVGLEEPRPAPAALRADAPSELMVTTRRLEESPGARSTEFVVDYQVPGRISIRSDREPRLFPLSEDRFAVDVVARVVPSRSPSAYVMGAFRYEGAVPVQPGTLQLFRDGAYVGSADTRGFLPGEDVRLPFGSDERVKVDIQSEAAKSRDSGLLSRERVVETRQRFTITSYHAAPVRVEVVDRLPIPKESAVRVTVLKDATPPTERNWGGREGVLLWALDAKPRERNVIRHFVSLAYPRERELEFDDQTVEF